MQLQVFQKTAPSPAGQVPLIMFMFVGFPLKADAQVSTVVAQPAEPVPEVLQQIPNVKWQYQKFSLLAQVNPFVPEQALIQAVILILDQYKWKQGHPPGGQKRNVQDQHQAGKLHDWSRLQSKG
jgi:hypothetical protein